MIDRRLDAELVEQPILQWVASKHVRAGRIIAPQRHGGHRSEHRVRAGRLRAECVAKGAAGFNGQQVIVPHQPANAAKQAFQETQGGWQAQPGGGIDSPHPVELLIKPAALGPDRVVAVADDRWANSLLPIAADVEEAGPFRAAEPLVAVAGVVSRPDAVDVERNHARSVSPIDERVDSPVGEEPDDPRDRPDQRRRTCHVVDHCQPGPIGGRREDRIDGLVFRFDGHRDLRHNHSGAASAGHVLDYIAAGIVGVIGHEQLIAPGKP